MYSLTISRSFRGKISIPTLVISRLNPVSGDAGDIHVGQQAADLAIQTQDSVIVRVECPGEARLVAAVVGELCASLRTLLPVISGSLVNNRVVCTGSIDQEVFLWAPQSSRAK